MDIGVIISFTIANALTSCLGAYIVKKRHPGIGYVKMVAFFFVGYIIFFWMLVASIKILMLVTKG